jgi:ABC-type uncharacterized transport system fused permease/ATPase subunit
VAGIACCPRQSGQQPERKYLTHLKPIEFGNRRKRSTVTIGKTIATKKEIRKVIVGQEDIIEEILVALLAGGHCLLEGVPGLAKTLMVRTLSQALDLSFRRIQFTPT